jgi:integrase
MGRKDNAEAAVIARHIHGFLSGPAGADRAAHTAKSHRAALTLYIGFLASRSGVSPATLQADCFGPDRIEEWLEWLRTDRGCSPATCNNRLSSLRAFLKHLGGRDVALLHLFEDASRIRRRRQPRRRPDGLTRDAVHALMRAPDQSTETGRRDLALMVTMYATACRIDELLSLKIGDLRLDAPKPSVTVTGKGSKIRTLHLLPKSVGHLKRHIEDQHGPDPDPGSYVFHSRNTGPKGKLTQPAVAKRLKKHARAAREACPDVPLTLHAHQFRTAKASHWLEDGMNIVQISFLLGHETIQTTMAYLDITTEQEAAALATLEDETDQRATKKWKTPEGGLAGFCGLDTLKT